LIRTPCLTSIYFVSQFSFLVGVIGISITALAACSKKQAPEPTARAEATTLTTSRTPTAPRAENPRDIQALFKVEADHRPKAALRVEQALSAFRTAGIALGGERQHLARPYGARYCVGAKSGPDVALSVCEYIDAAAAETGAAVSRKLTLRDREIRLRGATSLTVRLIKKTPESQAVEARLFDTFARL
jgi:hypothetical protein